MMVLIRKVRTLTHLSAQDRWLASRAIGVVAVVRFALWMLPFRWIRKSVASIGVNPAARWKLRPDRVAWAISLASRYVPRATCLTQALAASVLLHRAGLEHQLQIGVSRERGFAAHAWVVCGDSVLVGGSGTASLYAPILTLDRSASPVEPKALS